MTNVTPAILEKVQAGLMDMPFHPLNMMKEKINKHFAPEGFVCLHINDPLVTVKQNFDDLCFPPDHVGRTQKDSYYVNRKWMLRTHMTANERETLQAGHRRFLLTGDVYRRDEIDSTHYPVFHQLEGVCVFRPEEIEEYKKTSPEISEEVLQVAQGLQPEHSVEQVVYTLSHLQASLNGLLNRLFGATTQIRWQPCFFPFTQPSLEAEILHNGKWMEVFGSGLLQSRFLQESGLSNGEIAWAFGLGLERIAMILYDIPDIRLFWTKDVRFISQFTHAPEGVKFQPYSKHPHIARDLSFWLPSTAEFDPNSLYDLVRSTAGDLVESVTLVDTFEKDGKASHCYRVVYRDMNRTLTDEEVNDLQGHIRSLVSNQLHCELR